MSVLHLVIPPTNAHAQAMDSDARLLAIAQRGEPAFVLGDDRGRRHAQALGVTIAGRAPMPANTAGVCGPMLRKVVKRLGVEKVLVPRDLGVRASHAIGAVAGCPLERWHDGMLAGLEPRGAFDPGERASIRERLGIAPDELLLVPCLQPASQLMARRLVFLVCLLRVSGVPARTVVPACSRFIPEAVAFAGAAEQAPPVRTSAPMVALFPAADAVVTDWSLDARCNSPRETTAAELAIGALAGERFCTAAESPDRAPTANSRLPLLTAAVLSMLAKTRGNEAAA